MHLAQPLARMRSVRRPAHQERPHNRRAPGTPVQSQVFLTTDLEECAWLLRFAFWHDAKPLAHSGLQSLSHLGTGSSLELPGIRQMPLD